MRARGKREAQRNASPLVNEDNLNRALKVRNNSVDYSALSELHDHCACLLGATRLTLFGACPWLSYSAPLALLIVYLRLLEQSRTDQEKDHADQSNQAR